MQVTITFSASIAADDGTKAIGSSTTINANFVTSGVVTVGTTYAEIAPNGTGTAMIIYNQSSVDVAVRVNVTNNVAEYAFLNLIAGGVIVVPCLLATDGSTSEPGDQIWARASSGTADLEYCLIN